MNSLLRFCSIVSIIIVSFKLAIIGNLTHGSVIFIIVCGLLILLGNRTIYIIVAAASALVLFVKLHGGNSIGESSLLQSILTLALAVFGMYIMLKGYFRTRR